MDRRKFLIGTGSIAVGGAAVLGSGAFSNATVQREITADMEGDAAAVVQLNPVRTESDGSKTRTSSADGDYASFDAYDRIEIEFDDLNRNADFTFEDTLTIQNNGTETVNLDRVNEDEWYEDDRDNGLHVLVGSEVNEFMAESDRDVFERGSPEPELGPGDWISIGFGFWSPEGPGGGFGEDHDESIEDAIPETITFNLGG